MKTLDKVIAEKHWYARNEALHIIVPPKVFGDYHNNSTLHFKPNNLVTTKCGLYSVVQYGIC